MVFHPEAKLPPPCPLSRRIMDCCEVWKSLNISVVVLYQNPSLVHVGDCSRLKREITYCWRVSGGGNRNEKSRPRYSYVQKPFTSRKFTTPSSFMFPSLQPTTDQNFRWWSSCWLEELGPTQPSVDPRQDFKNTPIDLHLLCRFLLMLC
jgi:hypothetical protein